MKYFLSSLIGLLFCTLCDAQPNKKVTGFAELEKIVEQKRVANIKKDLNKKLTALKTKQPLFIVNGEIWNNLKALDTASVDSIRFIIPNAATKLYGAPGKKGALLITTRKLRDQRIKDSLKTNSSTPAYIEAFIVDTPWPNRIPEKQNPEMIKDENKIYTKTEIDAKFKLDWDTYVKKNLYYPPSALDEGISGKVVIQFIVDENSLIYDLKVAPESPLKNPSLVMEAIRILKKSFGLWIPAKQNGRSVSAYTQREISFVLPDE